MSDIPSSSALVPTSHPSVPSVPRASYSPRRFSQAFLATAWRWLQHPWRLLGIGVLLSIIGLASAVAGRHAWAVVHFRSGSSDLQRHHNAEALAHFHTCLHTWPDDPTVLLLAARASWRLQEFGPAGQFLKDYQRVAGSTDDFVRESFLVLAAQGELDRAETYCRDLMEREDPATPLILEALVSGCLRQYRLGEGTAFLQHWLDLQPDDTQALLFQIGLDHLRRRPDEIVALYERVLQLDPEHDSARFRLASTLLETRRCQEAIPHLETLRVRQPSNWHVLVLLAQCQDSLGKQTEAEQLLDRVLEEAPHDANALAERGRLALRTGQLDAAETWLRHALTHAPGNFQAHYDLGQCLLQRGQTAEVLKQQQRLKQLEADQKRLRRIMTQEMSQKPHDASLHREVAMISLRSGDVEGWLRWLHSALREDPTSAPVHRTLAEYYQQIGNQERAAYHRQFAPSEPTQLTHTGS